MRALRLLVIVLGVLLIVAGLMPAVHAFVQFAKAGGTPMPLAPPERLVVNGFNRYVRNPMYVGLLIAIARPLAASSRSRLYFSASRMSPNPKRKLPATRKGRSFKLPKRVAIWRAIFAPSTSELTE